MEETTYYKQSLLKNKHPHLCKILFLYLLSEKVQTIFFLSILICERFFFLRNNVLKYTFLKFYQFVMVYLYDNE